MNFFEGIVERKDGKVFVNAGGFSVEVGKDIIGDREEVIFAVRPEHLVIDPIEGTPYRIVTCLPAGSFQIAMANRGEENHIALHFDGEVKVVAGEDIKLSIKNDNFHIFDKKTEKRLN